VFSFYANDAAKLEIFYQLDVCNRLQNGKLFAIYNGFKQQIKKGNSRYNSQFLMFRNLSCGIEKMDLNHLL